MTNTLTGLYNTIYDAMNRVGREQVGMIPAVSASTRAARAALGQTIRAPIVPSMSAEDITPGATAASGGDRAISYVDLTISKSRKVDFHITGEEELGLGENNDVVTRDSFAQAFRTLANEIDSDLASLYTYASRAYGTAATAPFGTAGDFSDFAQMHKILTDNGAPMIDRQLVLNSAAVANIRGKQSSLFKANEAGTDELLRRGIIGMVEGFDIHESGNIKNHTAGTAASATTDNAGYAVGATTLALASAGTGTILAGDVITLAGDTNKYVVKTGDADVSGGGSIVLRNPGLRVAASAATKAITMTASHAANLAFTRDAIVLGTRPPAAPTGGDAADDRMLITDPFSRLTFEVAVYRQYRQVTYEVGIAWGFAAVKEEHIACLLG